jgi:(R)-2-hydroxyisocaproyl-CoA dehydratase beta subunit
MERDKNVTEMIAVFSDVARHPGPAVKKLLQNTGKKAIGCFPYYCPEELVAAAGMIPIGCWGGQIEIARAGNYFPPFACSIMQSAMEMAIAGAYDDLAAVIIPAPCDTLKLFGQNWIAGASRVPAIPIVYPLHKTAAGMDYLQNELASVQRKLEAIAGIRIADDAIHAAIELYNNNRRALREFVQLAARQPGLISPVERHHVIKSRFFMEKPRHTKLLAKLNQLLAAQPAGTKQGKKVILTGIMVEPDGILEVLADYAITIVADDLAQESRLFRTDVPAGENPLSRLAYQWRDMNGCSLIFSVEKNRTDMLIDMFRQTQADGIVVCMMKFCEPEEFDYPLIKTECQAASIPVLYLEIDQQTQSWGQVRTRVQAFVESLDAGREEAEAIKS